MGFTFHFGKFIFCSAIILYGYLIIFDPTIKKEFDQNFKQLQTLHPALIVLKEAFQYLDYIRVGFGAVNLMAVFMIFSDTRCIPSILTLSFLIFSAVLNNPFLVKDEKLKEVTVGRLLKTIAIVGGLVYLISCKKCSSCGAETEKKQGKKKKAE